MNALVDTVAGWRIERMDGFRISHTFMAVTPGCPAERHPTRWCRCRPFRTERDARTYITTITNTKENQ